MNFVRNSLMMSVVLFGLYLIKNGESSVLNRPELGGGSSSTKICDTFNSCASEEISGYDYVICADSWSCKDADITANIETECLAWWACNNATINSPILNATMHGARETNLNVSVVLGEGNYSTFESVMTSNNYIDYTYDYIPSNITDTYDLDSDDFDGGLYGYFGYYKDARKADITCNEDNLCFFDCYGKRSCYSTSITCDADSTCIVRCNYGEISSSFDACWMTDITCDDDATCITICDTDTVSNECPTISYTNDKYNVFERVWQALLLNYYYGNGENDKKGINIGKYYYENMFINVFLVLCVFMLVYCGYKCIFGNGLKNIYNNVRNKDYTLIKDYSNV